MNWNEIAISFYKKRQEIMPVENLDWYFTIAKQHIVCEDYALIGWEPIPYAIVCDGCSSSEHTDLGSRILAWSAKKALQQYGLNSGHPTLTYSDVGYAVIENARASIDHLDLNASCLDATLLMGFYVDGCCYVYVYGDGYVMTVDASGKLTCRKVSYEKNMPYYLTYWVDKGRKDLYISINEGENEVMALTEYVDEQERISRMSYDAPLVFTFPEKEYRLVTLASDGVSSLLSVEENEKVPVKEVLEQLVAYKTTKGEFVKRRTKRMLKNYSKRDISPTDDLSIATMLLNYEPRRHKEE